MLSHLLAAVLLAGSPGPVLPAPKAVLDSAIARMGGRSSLEGIVRIRREMLTQWQRVSFDTRPYTDAPSYEQHSDVRDYSQMAWRNTRTFLGAGPPLPIVDIVKDTVGIRLIRDKWGPLNVAYVDERNELFTFAPERLLLLAREAHGLKTLPDSAIGGLAHARVSATINGYPTVLFIRRGDGLPAMVRFRAGQPNDFGLAPWGDMEVEIWFSRWAPLPGGAILPTQWDTRRVGQPYKRISVIATALDTVASADSFAISDSLRQEFNLTARRPMHDLPLDSARLLEPRLVAFRTNGAPAGAVKLGGAWYLLEAGQAPFNAERAAQWLETRDGGARTAGAFVTSSSGANGGFGWLVASRKTVRTAPTFEPVGKTILRNHGQATPAGFAVQRGQWHQLGGDSVWVEPIDYPDAPGALYLYVPALKWAYSGMAMTPLQLAYLTRRLKERGFPVERTGSMRGVLTPLPSGVLSSAGDRK
ncbi:MAG TPA: hypothetical protein VG817_05600 [Gemmatimonadales bacterium]|nr:hypothetical protein [Gemmatimonadales bacterium]